MRSDAFKSVATKLGLAASVLLLASGASVAQQQINLTAGPSSVTLPDGSTVSMWGYSCGAVVSGSTATCAKSNPAATDWSPVVITVPTAEDLQINLTNSLSFGTTQVPTSLTIVGQLGGGLGTAATSTASPDHTKAQQLTWPIADPGATGPPPDQGPRVQSFSTEVAAGATTSLTWTAPRPGTYLIESGTHPSIQGPMGLYGMLVVTTAPTMSAGTAYPGVSYNADVPLLLSEIDPVQNNAVNTAVNTAGFSETMVWSGQLERGSCSTTTTTVCHADTDCPVTETCTIVPAGCGNPSSATYQQCYPPAVNYTPLYYMFNGVAFDKTNAAASLFPAAPDPGVTGNVLVRFVNAGLRMHVPSIVGSQTGTPAVSGFSLIAEDGNPLPGVTRVQSEVFLAAGKTYDVMVNVPNAGGTALPVFDRELSLSGNATARDEGMLAYIGINGAGLPSTGAFSLASTTATATADTYNSRIEGQTFIVSDPGMGVIANDTNIYGVQVSTAPTKGTLTLNENGTFTYIADTTLGADTFTYCGNGTTSGAACAIVTLGAATIEANTGIVMNGITYTSNVATALSIKPPGILSVDKDNAGYPLTVATSTVSAVAGPGTLALSVDQSGAFNASSVSVPGTYSFTYQAQNSQGTLSSATATVALIFPTPSNLAVAVLDGKANTPITDYRWIIEEDRTFYINPTTTANTGTAIVPTFGTNFHTSYMPVVARGCTGSVSCESGQTVLGQGAVCDVGNGVCRTDATQETPLEPTHVHLDPTKRYYISILPGDAAIPFQTGNESPGHGMGGAPIAAGQTAITVLTQASPFPTAKLSVFVFEDDFPLNGEQDAGGGLEVVLAPNEAGLGGFNITIMDDAGGTGDSTGQATYDMFNQPLSNSLAGTIDPTTGKDACPISKQATDASAQAGITGTIVTCPKFESDGTTLSPLAGQAVVANMYPGRYGVIATPAADRIARGEEWLQTNTLDGQKALDSFLRIGEPNFFQEYGPAGYHVSIGFANPKIINGRLAGVCAGTDINLTGSNCTNSITGKVTTLRMSRTPDERLYSSGSRDSFGFTQCYVSVGDPDGEDFAFTKCDGDGVFTLSGLPDGNWRVTTFDQWNDQLVDGLSTPVRLAGGTTDMGDIANQQWHANIYTRSFIDKNGDGVSQDPGDPGLALVSTNIRFRDGSFSNFNSTDLNGYAGFNEVFPLFSWYVVESDTTRYKNTGTHVVYDAGGPADGTTGGGTSTIAAHLANTVEQLSLPANLRVPGAVYCANADCTGSSIATGPVVDGSSGPTTNLSTGRIDPPWVLTEGWQGFIGQNSFLEFGKTPYVPGENGGIRGHVVYASTRPFDDPQLLLQLSWEPLVPEVTINLYQEGTAPDGSQSLTLVDHTKTSSWDDWAQGLRSDGVPNMNCPGQGRDTGTNADLFFFTLYNQPNWLDVYNNTPHTLPNNSQFKCYDGMHNWNQLQPAPYDGMYQFPSVTGLSPMTGKPSGTNCHIATIAEPWGCVPNPDTSDPYRSGAPMLKAGKYVVEMVVPPGYALVKEEDKNILIGDNYIAPAVVQFPNLGSAVYILPDQAALSAAYNPNNAQNPTTDLGATPRHEGDTGSIESFWPCVGQARIVPDYLSLFPQAGEVAPFAGATRNLCDRKEVTLVDQTSALAKFYVFTPTHVAAHFTGIITDDFTSEFDPFSPQFGEKFSPANLPVSIKDWTGTEISRVYTDQWGVYNGLNYSTWEVNPPAPTGYNPTMMITCMNDAGTGTTPDPLFNPAYSQFCYEIPFMPGQTQYMDTPVVPTSAFAGAGYNNPDCAYPSTTPAIKEVHSSDGIGPWVSAAGHTLTITALGDQTVNNNAYSGPSATTAPYNQKTITRHYGFGSSPNLSCNAGSSSPAVCPNVTVGGIPLQGVTWSDTTITGTVPTGVPNCALQQQAQYGGPLPTDPPTKCGELVIAAANGKRSIDAVTVTIGGKPPTYVASGSSIQSAIDAASPGDLIMVTPGVYSELLLMWKPVRLQGVGAASSVLDANAHPAGKLDPWRAQVNCLFGLALNGQPISGSNTFDSCSANMQAQVDRFPGEGILGWDATLNGNLAEQLQEPTLMGAYEGAGITVLAKGVNIPPGSPNPFGNGTEATFPAGTTLLTASDCGPTAGPNPYPSNFQCNPSSIDGLSITNSSQGGGGLFVHGWGHNLQIANNRVKNNAGTLTGGVTIGQGETPGAYVAGTPANSAPGSCLDSEVANLQLPYCFNLNVNMHHNAVTLNSSSGDELFSSTPSGAGGVTIAAGADYYKFSNNWVCGNLSTGDGGGVAQFGYSWYGDIEHNQILFNQSTNPTVPTDGGGLIVMGQAPDGGLTGECGNGETDVDCVPGLSDGTGPGLVIDANLFMGNAAESGSGGGLRLQNVNGTEVSLFPNGRQLIRRPLPSFLGGGLQPAPGTSVWNTVRVTNNIIANNVAGWDGGGVALQDALDVDLINNTIVSNDTTASSGVLFNTLGAPLAGSTGPTCTSNCGTKSAPQPAGLVAIGNSPILTASFAGIGTITCPANHPNCTTFSYPYLANDVFWQNRSFYIGVGSLGTGTQNQQNVVALYNAFTTTRAPSQSTTGACTAASYWDIGVRGDTRPSNHSSGIKLAPTYSVLTDAGDYSGRNNLGSNPTVVSQYCNGSRVPPERGSMGYQVPPGIADATVPNPIFNLTPAATVDEGNNWINISWGPLALTKPLTGARLGNYALAAGSPAIDAIPTSAAGNYPHTDFFGNPRPDSTENRIDIGAVETGPVMVVSLNSLLFGVVSINTNKKLAVAVSNDPTATMNLILANPTITAGTSGSSQPSRYTFTTTCPIGGTGLTPGSSCTITVRFAPTTTTVPTLQTARLNVNTTNAITTSVPLSGTGVIPRYTISPGPTVGHGFSNQQVGTQSAPFRFTLTNTAASLDELWLAGNPVLSGTFANQFAAAFRAGDTCTATTHLATGASCTFSVVFAPTSAGAKGSSASSPGARVDVTHAAGAVNSGGTGSPVWGTGVALTSSLSGTAAFGNQQLGTTSTPHTFTFTNTGIGPFTVTTVGLTGTNPTNYAIVSNLCTGATIPASGNCTFGVTFTPSATGSRTATLTATGTSGSATTTQTANLTGTGVAPGSSLTGGPPGFGNQQVGTTSSPHTFTFTNTGIGPFTVTTVGRSGTNAGNYAIVSNLCTGSTIPGGGNCTFGVTFTPSATGSRTATLTATGRSGTGTATTSSTASLTGTGVQAAVGFTWTNDGTVGAWGTVTGARTIRVTNTGTAGSSLALTAVPAVANLTGGSQFARTGGTCSATTVLAQSATCTVIVTRTRPASSPFAGEGTLTVTDTGAATASQVLNLSGDLD
jgi:hypothetical protein